MSAIPDDFEPVTYDSTTAAEAAPSAPEKVAASLPIDDGELEVNEPKRNRNHALSPKVRALFADIAKKHAEPDGTPAASVDPPEDLVPVDTTTQAAGTPDVRTRAAQAAAPATQQTAPVAAPVAPAVELPANAANAAAAAAAAAIEQERERRAAEREKALEEREKKLSERESSLLNPEALHKSPAAFVRDLVKQSLGAGATDADVADVVSDLLSELTADMLGTPLDPQMKQAIEARKALRQVKGYQAKLEATTAAQRAEAQKLEEQRKAQEQERVRAAENDRAKSVLSAALAPELPKLPFLAAEDNPHLIVWEVLDRQLKQHVKQYGEAAAKDWKADWPAAAKLANDFFKKQAESAVQKYQPLLTTTAPVAAAAKPNPQVSAQVPRSTTQPAAKPQPTQPDPDAPVVEEKWDRDARRNRGRETLRKTFSSATSD